jgi:hypothetical protein
LEWLRVAAAHYSGNPLSIWTLAILITAAWLSYPVAGAAGVAVAVSEGKRPKGAGFSFLPELIAFPAAFFGVAAVIDRLAMPWGRWIVGGLCILMFVMHIYLILRAIRKLHFAKKNSQ